MSGSGGVGNACLARRSQSAAQTSTGGLRGFVRDNSGLVMVGVTVEASSPARIGGPAVAVTDAAGAVLVHEPAGGRLHAGVHPAGVHDGPS